MCVCVGSSQLYCANLTVTLSLSSLLDREWAVQGSKGVCMCVSEWSFEICLVWHVLLTIDVREGVSLGVRDPQLLHRERIAHAYEKYIDNKGNQDVI